VHVPDPSSKRTLSTGELIGFAQKNSASQTWLGIPFAQPPVGALRWRAPQPPALWSGVREALNFGSACPQLANPIGDTPNAEPGTVTGHEDCLYLNVYAPRGSAEQAAQRKLPVMVWLHGGGNSVGHAGTYDGGDLAARYDLIVVTTNYRLGPFGWFRQPALLSDTPGDEQSGNWGMLDQIRALEWVRENVAAFGGDPGNVTIFGESAGGVDVLGLLVSKRAEGLFHRAISQSGGTNSSSLAEAENPTDAAQPGNKNSSAEATLRILFPGIGRADAAARAKALQPALIAARLRAASPKEVFAAYTAVKGARPGAMLDMPALVRDGSTLPLETEQELFAQGRYHHVPVILGTNHDELKLFLLSDPKLLRNWIRVLPMFRDELRYQVTSDYGTMGWKMSSLDAPAAEMRRVQGPSVFVYRFDWDEEPRILWSDFAKLLGAAHGMEIPFVFRHFEGNGFARLFTDANRPGREQLADAMSSYWANFAYTGAPGRGRNGKLPEWRAIDLAEGGDKQIVFDTAEGGGVRMDKHVITKASLLAQLARDPRMNDQIRCEIFQGMVDYKTLSPSDREAAGCTAKGLKGLGAR
jgi:para-nitrobenzyl esterase